MCIRDRLQGAPRRHRDSGGDESRANGPFQSCPRALCRAGKSGAIIRAAQDRNRDSPDGSHIGVNTRVFPAFLQERSEVRTATVNSGCPCLALSPFSFISTSSSPARISAQTQEEEPLNGYSDDPLPPRHGGPFPPAYGLTAQPSTPPPCSLAARFVRCAERRTNGSSRMRGSAIPPPRIATRVVSARSPSRPPDADCLLFAKCSVRA